MSFKYVPLPDMITIGFSCTSVRQVYTRLERHEEPVCMLLQRRYLLVKVQDTIGLSSRFSFFGLNNDSYSDSREVRESRVPKSL